MSSKRLFSGSYYLVDENAVSEDRRSSGSSERSLPAAWEAAVTPEGEVFYAEPQSPAAVRVPTSGSSNSSIAAGGGGDYATSVAGHPSAAAAPTASTSGKLRNLLRRRRSQKSPRDRAPQLTAVLQQEATAGEDGADGEVYRVWVRLDGAAIGSDPPSESLLGLITEHQLRPGAASQGARRPVVVAALTPSGPLVRNTQVHIGDRLERVNGVAVTAASLAATLLDLPRRGKVCLTFRRGALVEAVAGPTAAPSTNGTLNAGPSEGAVTSLTGDGARLEELGLLLRDVPYGLLCLSSEGLTESSPERQDIVYRFPGYDTALVPARGSLLTLAGLTPQVSGDPPRRVRVKVGEQEVHLAVTCEEDLVVLLAAPERSLSAFELGQLGDELWQLLRLEFGSVRSAFREEAHRAYVDHLLALVLQRVLLTPELTARCPGALPQSQRGALEAMFAPAHAMHLPRHVQVLIDDSLTELESGDFGEESEDFYGLQRLYLITGSALYYKGYLVGSHLSACDQAGIHLFLKHRQLLERCRRDGWRELVVWRRLHRPPPPPPPPGDTAEVYPSTASAHHLLLVGTGHAMLAVLLESGSCTVELTELTGPDTIYVEEAQATLFQLESMGILDMCESWLGGCSLLNGCSDPELPTGARPLDDSARDALVDKRWWSRLVGGKSDSSRRSLSSTGGGDTVDWERRSTGAESQGAGRADGADGSGGSAADGGGGGAGADTLSQSEDGSCSTDGSGADTWEIYRGPPKNRLLPNQYDLMENKKIYISQALEDSRRVVPDVQALVLQYVLLEGRTALLAVPEPAAAAAVRPDLLATFSAAVARLRPLLAGQQGQGGALGPPREVGTLFSLDGADQQQTFWVVGRQMAAASDRQLFVCVPGSTPPNMVEMAFALSHGTGPW